MKRVLALLWMVMVACMCYSCDKYDSIIYGKLTYISEEDGAEHVAAGALVTKCKLAGDDTIMVSSVIADAEGSYSLDYVTKGEWILKSVLKADTLVYTACSNVITATGKAEDIEKNMVLKLNIVE